VASDGLVQLGLVTIGAAAGFVPGYLVERARWQRETVAEWRHIRRDNIRSFMTLMSRLTHETIMLGEALHDDPLPGDSHRYVLSALPAEPAAGRGRRIDELRDSIAAELEELKLIGSAEQVRLAKNVLSKLNDLTALAKRGGVAGDAAFDGARVALKDAKAEFRERVRAYLGVESH
jgi:hypothetical protein